MQERMTAPCGLDCAVCPIFIAAGNPEEAERLAEGWRSSGHPKAEAGWFRCQGCRGDRSVRWSEECAISTCCVDDRRLEFCSQCEELPCARLREWAEKGAHHRKALDRLKEMKKGSTDSQQ